MKPPANASSTPSSIDSDICLARLSIALPDRAVPSDDYLTIRACGAAASEPCCFKS